jgi:hypothetical protein
LTFRVGGESDLGSWHSRLLGMVLSVSVIRGQETKHYYVVVVMQKGYHLLVMRLHLTAIELLLDDSKIGMI